MEDLRFPIGPFEVNEEITNEQLRVWIKEIGDVPKRLQEAVQGLNDEQLDTPYRSGGWTIRQVVHHIADSHMNSFIRFKLALTENSPTIKPYAEEKWAALADSKLPVAVSVSLVEALHERWVSVLEGMSEGDFERTFVHPDAGVLSLKTATGLYAWHGRHHLAHITSLRQRSGW